MANVFDRFDRPAEGAPPPPTGDATQPNAFDQFDRPGEFTGEILPAAPYSATDALAHGFTLGMSDPVGALGTATGRWLFGGQPFDYPQAAREVQRGREAYEGANPWTNTLLNLVGGLGMVGPNAAGAAVERAPSLISQMVRGGGIGAGMGAVTGAADNAASLPDAASGAGMGAALGAGLGAALPLPLRGLQSLLPWLGRSALNPLAGEAPARTAADRADDEALRMINRAAGRTAAAGGPSLDAMGQRLDATNAPLMLADVGGRPVQRLAGSLYRSDTPASEIIGGMRSGPLMPGGALTRRDEGAGERLVSAVNQFVSPHDNSDAAIQGLRAQQRAQAGPAYRVAMDPSRPIYSDALQTFLDQPEMRRGFQEGMDIHRMQAVRDGLPFNPADYSVSYDAAGNPIFGGRLNMNTLDAVKQGLDAQVAAERNDITGQLTPRGAALDGMRRAYVAELDRLNPDYATARAAYGGPAHAMDLIRQGQAFNSQDHNALARTVGDMSPADQTWFRLGAAQTMRNGIQGRGYQGDEALGLAPNQMARNRIRAVLNNQDDFDALMQAADTERQMFGTRYDIVGGSHSAERLAADGRPAGTDLVVPAAIALGTGGPTAAATTLGVGVSKNILNRMVDRLAGPSPQAQVSAAHMLMATNPAQRQMIIDRLLALNQPQPPRPYLAPLSGLLPAANAAAAPLTTGLLAP